MITKIQKQQLESLEAVERERERERERQLFTLRGICLLDHTHTNWKRLTNRLAIVSLVLAYNKIEKENIRLSKHTKSM